MKKIAIFVCVLSMLFSNSFVYGDVLDPLNPQNKDKNIEVIDNQYNRYMNDTDGYMLKYPNHMQVDTTLSSVKTVIADEEREIEIYYDDFNDTVHSSRGYIFYSNVFIKNSKDHIKQYENTVQVNGMKTHLLVWSRKKLNKVKNDKNYYVSAEIKKNDHEVYTIFIKSTRPFSNYEDYMDIINSFHTIKKLGNPRENIKFKPTEKRLNTETEAFYEKYFLKNNQLKWGIFEPTAPKNLDYLNKLEKNLDYTFEFLIRYQDLDEPFPMEEMKNAYNNNRYVELTLQTMHKEKDNSSIIYDILDGKYDDYFNEYAKQIKEFNHPILFRLNNEMNGDWCVYSSYYTSKDTELYTNLWKYFHNIFDENGVDNVLWVWNPHDVSFPSFKWNHSLNYYPGDEYVDIIGLTGYNTGTYYRGEKWREFDEVYPSLYEEYMSIFEQPFMITEFGSNEVGGDKTQWVNKMFDSFEKNQFNNIKVAIWWNGIDWDQNGNPARIYRLDRSTEMINTFKERLNDFDQEKEITLPISQP